jgi:hypothetical protein
LPALVARKNASGRHFYSLLAVQVVLFRDMSHILKASRQRRLPPPTFTLSNGVQVDQSSQLLFEVSANFSREV